MEPEMTSPLQSPSLPPLLPPPASAALASAASSFFSPTSSVYFLPQSSGKARGSLSRVIPLLIASFTATTTASSASLSSSSSLIESASPSSPALLYRIGAKVLSVASSTRPQHTIKARERLYLLRHDTAPTAAPKGQQQQQQQQQQQHQQQQGADEAPAYDAAAAFIRAEQLDADDDASAVALESCNELLESHRELVRPLQLCSLEPAEQRRERFVLLRHPHVYRLRFPSHLSLRSLELVTPAAVNIPFPFFSQLAELLSVTAKAKEREEEEEEKEEAEEQEASRSSRRQNLQHSRQRRLLEESAQFVERVEALQHRQRQKEADTTDGAEAGKEAAAADGKEKADDESRKDRPLRTSIKLRQQQLQDEKRRQQEESKRRQQEKVRLQEEKQKKRESRRSAGKAQPASRASSASSASATASVAETAAVPPSSLRVTAPASASAAASPSPLVRPVLVSAARKHGLVLPAHCYGYEWRLVLKVVDCVFALLSSRHCSRIDWQDVAAMVGTVTALSARECRMLWRYAAYSMSDLGCSNRKRLEEEPEDEQEADGSDIDVDLPAGAVYNGSDVIRASCSSEQRQQQELDSRSGVWSAALDHALLVVVSLWMDKTRQAQSAAATASMLPAAASSSVSSSSSSSSPSLSSSSFRPLAADLSSLPSTRSDWSFISCVFLHHSGIRRSAAFLQHRFALLCRITLTTGGEAGERGKQTRSADRELLLQLLAVSDAMLREQALHGGGKNCESEKRIADRRSRRRRAEREEIGKRGPEWEIPAHAAGRSALTLQQSKRRRVEDEHSAPAVAMEERKEAGPAVAVEQPAAAVAAAAAVSAESVSASAPLPAPGLIRTESTDPPSSQSSSSSSGSLQFVSAASDDSGDRS